MIAEAVIKFIDYRLTVNSHVKYGKKEEELFFKVRGLNNKGRLNNQALRDMFRKRFPQKTKSCAFCGMIFPYVRSDHQFCSRKCVDAAYFSKESSTTIRHASDNRGRDSLVCTETYS